MARKNQWLSIDSNLDDRMPITQALLQSVRRLGEFKGRESLYRSQMPQALETLRQAAIIQSAESSNRIEGVTAPPQRLRALMAEKTKPQDRSEQEIAGYRDVLNTIHGNHEGMRFTASLVLQLHRDLFKYTSTPGGRWKSTQNAIIEILPSGSKRTRFEPVAPHLVSEAMDLLHVQFTKFLEEAKIDPLILIPVYVLDFLCIHPFLDGNGRMARLLTLLLLYQAGYGVGRYISLERVVEESKESYYDTLYRSSQGWHEGRHTLVPWTEYFLGTMLAAYKEFENRVGILTDGRGAKTELVLEAIRGFYGDFSVSELQAQCPNVGIDLIRRLLRQERKAGNLECLGRGPAARWRQK
jgi:Fic family protein